jgi:hypothetical protein
MSDGKGRYQIGELEATAGMASISVRAEASGYAPGIREVRPDSGITVLPPLSLTPLTKGVRVGGEGGEFQLPGGVVVHVPGGAVGADTEIGVTLLHSTVLGPVQPGDHTIPTQAFHLSTGGAVLSKPIQAWVPLGRHVRPGTWLSVWIYRSGSGKWENAGPSEVSEDGLHLPVLFQEGGIAAVTMNDIGTRQTGITYTPSADGWQRLYKCVWGPGDVWMGDLPYNTDYESSIPAGFGVLNNHLYSLYGGNRLYPSHIAGSTPEGWRGDVWVRALWLRESRTGMVWLNANPADQHAYGYAHTTFLRWDIALTKCDAQGGGGIIATSSPLFQYWTRP